jgi:hypothetical protein
MCFTTLYAHKTNTANTQKKYSELTFLNYNEDTHSKNQTNQRCPLEKHKKTTEKNTKQQKKQAFFTLLPD